MESLIKELLKDGSRKSVNYAEKILLDYYSKYLKNSSIDFDVNNLNSKQQIYSDKGLLGYEGSTILEIKLYKLPNGMYKFTEQELQGRTTRIESLISSKANLENLILVINSDAYESIRTIENRIEELKHKYKDVNLIVYKLEDFLNEIESSFEELSEALKDLSDKVFKDEINDALKEKNTTQSKRNEDLIKELRDKYKSDKMVLFLGAGASKDAGMPLWNELLSDMFVSYLEKPIQVSDEKILFSESEKQMFVNYFLNSNDRAPTIQSMYIKTMGKEKDSDLSESEKLRSLLHQVMYKNCIKRSSLIYEIIELCRPKRSSKGLHAIINYNFDNLIEQNLHENKVVSFKSIIRDFEKLDDDDLPIYHVHGYVPQDLNENEDVTEKFLIFTDDEYHKIYNDHYHWANLIQLNQLKEKTCIFVGMSMTDPNLRRMLDLAKEKEDDETIKKHYAILQRDRLKKNILSGMNKRHIKAFENSNQRVRELYFEDLGVNVIWYDEHDEIPEILRKIRKM